MYNRKEIKRFFAGIFLMAIAQLSIGQPEQRPDYNDGTGFFVKNGKIYDHNGIAFTPYGVNNVHVWLDEANSKNALKLELKKARMNTVRLVTAGESWTWNNQSATPAQKKELVKLAVEAHLIPILELHDGTCLNECDKAAADGKMGLKQIVDHWLLPDNVAMLKEYEQYLWLNIANEWGPDADNDQAVDYLNCYKESITRLREAGIKNLLVIDAGGCGQDPRTLLNYTDQLLEHDPQHNIVASIHLYGLWRSKNRTFTGWTPPYVVEDVIPQLAAMETPVFVGEFGWTDTGTSVNYDPKILVQTCKASDIGWLFWAWHSNDTEPFFNISTRSDLKYFSSNDLSAAGKYLVDDPEFGFKSVAIPASMFPGVVTGVENRELNRSFKVFPNPAGDTIYIKSD